MPIPAIQKKVGRPTTGITPMVHVRMPPAITARIDAYAVNEGIDRSEAIRRLVGIGLSANELPQATPQMR